MDVLSQLRQDPASFVASAAVVVAEGFAEPVAVERHEPRWWVEPDDLAAEPNQPALDPHSAPTSPAASPAPCPACACPMFWRDLTNEIHCCECVGIPSPRMVRDAWRVAWNQGKQEAYWMPYQPVYWQPFSHPKQEDLSNGF
jgi:hypothetical protein